MTTIKVTPEQLLAVSKQFEVAQHRIYQMNNILKQRLFEIEREWNGSTKEKFYVDFTHAQQVMDNFVTLSMSISKELRGHAEKFKLVDSQTVQSYDPRCAPPPPDECRAPAVDTRNVFQKSADSLAELGRAFMQSADDRYQKRYDSIGGFLDYWTFGIPSGLVQGYMDRADKAFNSPNDTANWLTFGIHGTIREATFPTNAWSSEHWANMIGMGGMLVGTGYASSLIKPHNLLTTSGGGVKINAFNRPPGTGQMTGGFNGFQDQRLRVMENISESKKARESSKFSEFVEKEKEFGKNNIEDETVAYYRVQGGGNGSKTSQYRIVVHEDGSIEIPNKKADLNVSAYDLEHALYYRDSKRPGGEIVEFQVPKWLDDFVKETLIPQDGYKTNPLNQQGTAVKIVDPTTPGTSYEFPVPWMEWIEEYGSSAKKR